MLLMLHITCSCIFHAYVPFFFLLILNVFVTFLGVSLSLSLSLSLSRLVTLWHLNVSPLCPRTFFVLGNHLLLPLLILHLLMSGSVMIQPVRTFWRTFPDAAFI